MHEALTGRRFGRWTVMSAPIRTPHSGIKYRCRCDCGTERDVLARSLRSGASRSCGCLRRETSQEVNLCDLLGRQFGDLQVIGKCDTESRSGARWMCRCSCGNTCEAAASDLIFDRTTSCGCKKVRRTRRADVTGQRFGRLVALEPTAARDEKGSVLWHCRCDCGSELAVSYNNLMYSTQRSCGCRKREHDKALPGYLTHVDGTSIDALRSRKLPAHNTTGVKGVYAVRGRYIAKIVFQHKQYFLGSYKTLEAAAAARAAAEKAIADEVVGFYEKWRRQAEADPEWAARNPIRIQVDRVKQGELKLILQPTLP